MKIKMVKIIFAVLLCFICVSMVANSAFAAYPNYTKADYYSYYKSSLSSYPTIGEGSANSYVKTVQIMLRDFGYNLGPSGIDGIFGSYTKKAVQKLQRRTKFNNINAVAIDDDGIVGPYTWGKLVMLWMDLYS